MKRRRLRLRSQPPRPRRNRRRVPTRSSSSRCAERCSSVRRASSRPLRAGHTIPFGATVDTKAWRGRARVAALPRRRRRRHARFRDGIFRVTQSRDITDLTLTEELNCSRRASAAQEKKPKSRKLWGDGKGKFRTKGRYAAATVRGTKWLVQDACTTTLVRVTQGSVSVRDQGVRKRNVIVRKGKRYLAEPRR